MKILIVDNEANIREYLCQLLIDNGIDKENIIQADGIHSGLEKFKKVKPNVIFLDVELDDGTGFDFLNKVNDTNFQLIFITAYQKYAIQAFRYCAIDFLLKPIDSDELTDALGKVKENLLMLNYKDQFEVLKSMISAPVGQKPAKIILKNSDSIFYVKIDDIIKCQADGPYSIFEIENQNKIIVSNNIKIYEELLAPHGFVRVHNSYLVNASKIIRYDKQEGGYLILDKNQKIPLSQRKKEEILNKLRDII